jgi:hypothetical protein
MSVSIRPVRVHAGREAILTCIAEPPLRADQLILMLWIN